MVVSIRGTYSLEDVLTDLHLSYEDYELSWGNKIFKGHVHSGMMTSARHVSNKIKPLVLHALDRNPDYTLVITGHSLGAGTSAMLALLWKTELHIIERNMEVYCYCPAASNSVSLNKILQENVLSCSFGHDVVAKASIGTASDLAEMMIFMEEAEKTSKLKPTSIIANYLTSSKSSQEIIDQYKEVQQFVASAYFERLVPPGMMFQIFKKGFHDEFEHASKHPSSKLHGDNIAGIFFDPCYHQEIILSPTLVADHSCVNMQYTLQRMWGITHILDFNDPNSEVSTTLDNK